MKIQGGAQMASPPGANLEVVDATGQSRAQVQPNRLSGAVNRDVVTHAVAAGNACRRKGAVHAAAAVRPEPHLESEPTGPVDVPSGRPGPLPI